MKTPFIQPFDANFEALLREAAADPRSILLRVRRPQVFPALRRREAAVSSSMAGLSRVERELLASYRCELGFLLRQAIVSSILGANNNGWIDSSFEDNQAHAKLDEAQWSSEVTRSLTGQLRGQPEDVDNARDLLAQLVLGGLRACDILQLAAVALRVEPSDKTRIYAGTYLAALGHTSRSLEVSRVVLDGAAGVWEEAYAREGVALALGRAGRFGEASDILRDAQPLNLPRAELPLRYLFYSALSANSPAVLAASSWIEESFADGVPAIDTFCSDVRQKIARGQWSVNREVISTARASTNHVGEIAAKVLNEIIR